MSGSCVWDREKERSAGEEVRMKLAQSHVTLVLAALLTFSLLHSCAAAGSGDSFLTGERPVVETTAAL